MGRLGINNIEIIARHFVLAAFAIVLASCAAPKDVDHHIVVSVHDKGHSPADRLAGLVPASSSTSGPGLGLGLWVMHQLDVEVALVHADDGFTVRLRGGR